MGYIAPNVWMVNEYGKALRQHIRRTRRLDRWLDFKSHQVFDEAITYTALQFFRGSPADSFACAFAPDGAIAADWTAADRIPYDQLPEEDAWTLAPKAERELIDRLNKTCKPLSDCCQAIVVGIQTSADSIYHLKRISPDRYETKAGETVTIEDALMRPLVSGPEAKRYLAPQTDTFVLFPYRLDKDRPQLIKPAEIQIVYPSGWKYIQSHEKALRGREDGKHDDDEWYRFGRNQNLDKQELQKLIVAQTVPNLRVCYDSDGAFFLNNVRVNGILPADHDGGWYLLGILNAPVADFIFRKTAKAKQGGWYEANKQFIAPLPIPDASPEDRAEVARRAQVLQDLHTRRRDTIEKLDRRLRSPQTTPLTPEPGPEWLWSEIGTPSDWKKSPEAPADLKPRDLAAWAKARHAEVIQNRLDQLDALLQPGVTLTVEANDDELALRIQGREVLRLYDRPDTPFIAAQWRHAVRDVNITEAFDAKRLLRLLLDLRTTADTAIRDRILALDAEIRSLDDTIAKEEAAQNTHIYRLYKLTPAEIAAIEAG
jgi:hypothetical protein